MSNTLSEALLQYTLPFFRAPGGEFPADLPIYEARGLANYLENVPAEWGEWQFRQSASPDILEIVIPCKGKGSSHVVAIDLSKGANIVRSELWTDYGTPEAACSYRMDDMVLEQYGEVWLPTSFALPAMGTGIVGRFKLVYEGVNEDLDKSDFVLDFPDGLKVYDAIRGVDYIAGETEDAPDAPEQVREPKEREETVVAAVGELQRLRAQPASSGIVGAVPSSSDPDVVVESKGPWGGWRRFVVGLVAAVLCILVVILVRAVRLRVSRRPAE